MSGLYTLFQEHPKISTDSRRIERGSIFFALHGASFDGNRFAADALAKGAAAAVVDDPAAVIDSRTILVEDTLQALQSLAREHRRALGIPILAIAGSNGKTTTKELTGRVLAERFRTGITAGNLNNHIGVPLTLLSMDSTVEFGVVEMGASACGEIALLCEIAEPDFGILTNIGRSHLEGFGGVEGIRRGKGELYDYLAAHGGLAFVRQEDDVLMQMAAERKGLHAEHYTTSLANGVGSRLEGRYNLYNIAAAVAVGRRFGVAEESIRRAIAGYIPDNNRSQRTATERNTLIVDCYNANPTSMQLSVESFLEEPLALRSRRLLILGDMKELGEWSHAEHTAILAMLAGSDAELWLVGPNFAAAHAAMTAPPRATLLADCAALTEHIAAAPVDNALVLIKGSHSIGLEKAVAVL